MDHRKNLPQHEPSRTITSLTYFTEKSLRNLRIDYIQQVLSSELKEGDMVICDNLSSHKVAGVREAIEARGAELLYLPAYSPDLNPIEMAFSTLKAILRQQAQRSFEGLLQATSFALDRFSPNECINFFNHANYASYYIVDP